MDLCINLGNFLFPSEVYIFPGGLLCFELYRLRWFSIFPSQYIIPEWVNMIILIQKAESLLLKE